MSDRINCLIVVLEHDARDDDCASLIAAIEQLRGVASVRTRVVSTEDYIAQTRAKLALRQKLLDLLTDEVPTSLR